MATDNPCLHCEAEHANWPRGLCQVCYRDKAIRLSYPICKPRTNTTGLGLNRPKPLDAVQPTAFLPGSNEKIALFTARLEAGQELFHPEDAGACDDLDLGVAERYLRYHRSCSGTTVRRLAVMAG